MPELTPADIDEILKALAHPQRRQILVWLKTPAGAFPTHQHPFDAGVCAGKIHEKSGLSPSTMSAHLAVLQRAGLVSTQKIGQWIYYSRNEALIALFKHEMPDVF